MNKNNEGNSSCCGKHGHGHNHDHHEHGEGCCGKHGHGHNHDHHDHDHHEHGEGCCGKHGHGHNHDHHDHNHHEHGEGCCGKHGHGHNHDHHEHNHHGHNHFGTVHGHFDPADSPLESYLLKTLKAANFLPLAQFVMKSEKSSHFESVALSPVFIISETDDIDKIKATGAALRILENYEYITLDYDIPLDNYSYDEYKTSPVYQDFVSMMEEAATKEDFVYDTPSLNFGSIALTEKGEEAVSNLEI